MMVKKGVKVKISTMIITQVIISVILMMVLGFVSMTNGENSQRASNELFDITNKSDKYISKVEKNILEIRIQVIKGMCGEYTPSLDAVIKEKNEGINEMIAGYRALPGLTAAEDTALNDIEASSKKYIVSWERIRDKIINKVAVSVEDNTSLTNDSVNIVKALDEASKANIKAFNEDKVIIENNINGTRNKIFYIMIGTILILGILSYVVIRYIKSSVTDFRGILQEVSDLDLSIDIKGDKTEFGQMKNVLGSTVKDISLVMSNIKDKSYGVGDRAGMLSASSIQISGSMEEVSKAIQEVASGANQQSENLQIVSDKIDILSDGLVSITTSVVEVDKSTDEAVKSARQGSIELEGIVSSIDNIKDSFKDVTVKIKELSQNIESVSRITGIIDSIAGQTNLLALNAAIEAARAGETGRGFAVVADEVRKLAEQSQEAVKDINGLINKVTNESRIVEVTTNSVNADLEIQATNIGSSIEGFKLIIEAIEAIAPQVTMVIHKIQDLNQTKSDLLTAVAETAAISEEFTATSQEIAASSEEVAASSEEVESTAKSLLNESEDMIGMINKFKL
ncbi:MAG: methyl-accepting chemotaxis protein [Clostridium sp.]